jgi:putative mycofactocin binding protein MftB
LTVTLESELRLHPQVALRPEPFGALAYHYGNRRLVFLKHPDVVSVVKELDHHTSVAETLAACGVAETRWPSFVKALDSLQESDVVCVRDRGVAGP